MYAQSPDEWYKAVSPNTRQELPRTTCPIIELTPFLFLQLPVITRYYVTFCFLTTAGCALEVGPAWGKKQDGIGYTLSPTIASSWVCMGNSKGPSTSPVIQSAVAESSTEGPGTALIHGTKRTGHRCCYLCFLRLGHCESKQGRVRTRKPQGLSCGD